MESSNLGSIARSFVKPAESDSLTNQQTSAIPQVKVQQPKDTVEVSEQAVAALAKQQQSPTSGKRGGVEGENETPLANVQKRAAAALDANGNGEINKREFDKIFNNLGLSRQGYENAQRAFNAIAGEDGTASAREFANFLDPSVLRKIISA